MADWLVNRKYTTTLKLIVTDNNTFSGDVSLGIPVSVGSTSIGLTGGLALTDNRTVKLAIHGDFASTFCDLDRPPAQGKDWRLGGTIGLETWLKKLRKETMALKPHELGTFDHNLLFTIKPSHSLKPRFTLVPAGLTGAGLNPGWTSFREDKHSIDIQVTKKVPNTVAPGSVFGKPLYVAVTNQPTVADPKKLQQEKKQLGQLDLLLQEKNSQLQSLRSTATPENAESRQRSQDEINNLELRIQNKRQIINRLEAQTTTPQLRRRTSDPSRTAREQILQQRFDEQQQNISRQNDQLDQLGIE